jgi:preprotein translocase subunit YajC
VGPLGLMTPQGTGGQAPVWMQFAPLLFFFIVIYFLMIRPARARQKETQAMLDALRPGDRVTTSGGLLGTVVAVDREVVQLRIADKVKVDVTRSAIVHRQEGSGASPDA